MHRRPHAPKTLLRRPIVLAIASFVSLTALSASAQEASPDAVEPEQLDTVIVTGTRLPGGAAAESPSPVQVISAETIEQLGATEIAQVLNLKPALRSSAGVTAIDGTPPTLDLRGMGVDRTLVLVNGRRHVAGIPGSAAVDVSSIPVSLIERVEVLTGGASAVYGSDAVTGVVNFVLKDNFIGTDVSVQGGLSSEGDGERFFGSLTHGWEFADGRGHMMFSAQAENRQRVLYGDRDWSRDGRVATHYPNPALYFQHADGVPTSWVGRTILVQGAPRYADTPPALVDRARNATPRAFGDYPTWNITSNSGLIGFSPWGLYAEGAYAFNTPGDLDGNGLNDCTESGPGRGTPGWVAGCWVIDPVTGQVRTFRDGVFAGTQNNFGGDGATNTFNNQSLQPQEDAYNFNLIGSFEVTPAFQPYVEAKYAYTKSRRWSPYNTFDDSIPIYMDNPFIPDALRALVEAEIAADPSIADTAHLTIARDHIDIWNPVQTYERETFRAVVGARGELGDVWRYDASLNYGRTRQDSSVPMRLEDRFFAAVDAVIDPGTGQAVCRSTLDPTALPSVGLLTPGFPGTISGFTTFTPGAGSACQPLNLFGLGQNSAEALAFQNYYRQDQATIEQFVASAVLLGDSSPWFRLPGGPVGFVLGGEYREEKSESIPDAYVQSGYGFQYTDDQVTTGKFDVAEIFAEVGLPLLSGVPFADTLALNGAIRHSDYSTIGEATTWKTDLVWAPIPDIRFRAGYAETIRAPNIAELYAPLSSATFRPVDPCDAANVNSGSGFREANCRADIGLPAGPYEWEDPLTARFIGQSGGNPDLLQEEARSKTLGVVFRPRFAPGFWASIDYWSIEISNAIAAVAAQDIVDNCYDAPSLDNPFCALFTRISDPGSPTFGGFNYLLQTQTNFAGLEASGIDFSFNYRFPVGSGALALSLDGTYLEDRNNYPFPSDPDVADPEKGELFFPEWTANVGVDWIINDAFSASLFSTWSDSQYIVEIENAEQYTPASVGSSWVHNVSFRWRTSDRMSLTLGVNNLTNEEPFFSLINNPAPAIGRYFFARLNVSL